MNITRAGDHNTKAALAAKYNEFYTKATSPEVKVVGNYRIIKEIGEGSFSKAYLAKHVLLNIKVVLKCGSIDDPCIVREVFYHKQLKHKNIAMLYEVIRTEKHLWIALEYCQGDELYYHIYERRLSYNDSRKLFYQIASGIAYVHSQNLAHRDLKLENILLQNKAKTIVKLTDFGFVREFNPRKRNFLSTICGTTVYMAPEILKGDTYSGFAIDIWSLGVILYTMLYGEMPFDEGDDLKTKAKILDKDPEFYNTVPSEAVSLVKAMLSKSPKDRPSIEEVLASPFLLDLRIKNQKKNEYKRLNRDSAFSLNDYYHNLDVAPFSSKTEKKLLKRFRKLNIDIRDLENDILNNNKTSLSALFELSLTMEYSKKKRKYVSEKKNYRYAKKSLKSSGRRVRSALLSDSSSIQPLEKIMSSLSMSSNKDPKQDSVKINPEKSTDQTRTTDDKEQSRVDSKAGSNSLSSGKTESVNQNGRNSSQQNLNPILSVNHSIENSKKKNKILDKFQFWKKPKDSGSTMTSDLSSKHKKSSETQKSVSESDLSSNRQHKATLSSEPNSTVPAISVKSNNGKKSETPPESKMDTKVECPDPVPLKATKPRPSSLVSQVSQVSHLSQFSQMLSDSDAFLETDDMEDDLYDEANSVDVPSQDLKRNSASAPPVPSKKIQAVRPANRRTVSSDMSIVSTSTTNTVSSSHRKSSYNRVSMSQLSTTSSEESSPSQNTYSSSSHAIGPVAAKPEFSSGRSNSIDGAISQNMNTVMPDITSNPSNEPTTNVRHHIPIVRSNSPPFPNKFNSLKVRTQKFKSKFPTSMNSIQLKSPDGSGDPTSDENQYWNKPIYHSRSSSQGPNMQQAKFVINEEKEI
ncbi:Piso0_004007 [Millerozyma farinosa CBS 7064]|uniref:non-specific serine/threonine protein kinase n=1 Tax=Pichia sorbitophila (strain ATCC MYA-4447 / BCRC 22081 / CBS 7064 / NBRC 10061 / NRRL Y-12695) TaxID=559304 RepID=G8Y783_PICSO|nr:Piso0_004007 [Millerozyma farinosa CBS 7064]CCE84463.1 Piso0_004007 [Millerozyma farinosa CBS 7064]